MQFVYAANTLENENLNFGAKIVSWAFLWKT